MILRLLPFVVLLVACSISNSTGTFVLINKCDKQVKHVHIEISGSVFDFKNIMPQGKRTGRFKVKGDSHYDIAAYFEGGKKIRRKVGYVTNGFNYKHIINITENDITIADSKIE